MKLAAKIDENRHALLRIISCWLVFARLFRCRGEKPLPRRLSNWIADQIWKAEKAAYFLGVAIGYQTGRNMRAIAPQPKMQSKTALLTIATIIARLRALKATLRALGAIFKLRKPILTISRQTKCSQSGYIPIAHLHILALPLLNSRAPPTKIISPKPCNLQTNQFAETLLHV